MFCAIMHIDRCENGVSHSVLCSLFSFSLSADASLDDLVRHVLHALKGASQKKLTSRNVCVGFVGANAEFRLLEGEDIRAHVAAVTQEDDEDEEEDKAAADKKKKEAGAGAEEKEEDEEKDEEKKKEEEEAAAAAAAAAQMQE